MKVINHRLCDDNDQPVEFVDVANYDRGPKFKFKEDFNRLEYVIMHCTVSDSLQGTCDAFNNPAHQASAHLVIDRDGTILQCVPFDTFAWHAGDGHWADRGKRKGVSNWNSYSIGIEMVNWGCGFEKLGNIWRDDRHSIVLPEEDVTFDRSKHGFPAGGAGWQRYPDIQIAAALEAVKALLQAYPSILDIVSHEDTSKAWSKEKQLFYNDDESGDPMTNRSDPGPAFPMEDFRALALGINAGEPEKFQAILNQVVPKYRFLCVEPGLFGRQGANETSRKLADKEIVDVIERKFWWAKVRATNVDGTFLEGWMPERYLKRVKPAA